MARSYSIMIQGGNDIMINNTSETNEVRELKMPEILKHLGVIGQRGSWTIEANYVQYEDRPPQVDIRRWSPDHQRMGKGITLFEHEFEELMALNGVKLEKEE